ncbi:MAG TPA: hypothetical protein VF166_08145 [Gemmatimonadaceae bacterium]
MSSITKRIGLIVTSAALGCSHATRSPTPAPHPSPRSASAEEQTTPANPRRAIAKLAMGDAVIAVYARGDDRVEVGSSASNGSVLLAFAPTDVEQWATIVAKLLKSPVRSSRRGADLDRATLTEPGVAAGAITLSRRVTGRRVRYSLFFANRNFGGFAVSITKADANVLVTTLRNAAAAATATSPATSDTTMQRDTTR